MSAEIQQLRAEAAEGQRRWRAAHEHATDLEARLRDVQGGPVRVEAGAAPIADRVLRHARQEAARIRAVALREADLLLDGARHAAAGRERRTSDEQERPSAS